MGPGVVRGGGGERERGRRTSTKFGGSLGGLRERREREGEREGRLQLRVERREGIEAVFRVEGTKQERDKEK